MTAEQAMAEALRHLTGIDERAAKGGAEIAFRLLRAAGYVVAPAAACHWIVPERGDFGRILAELSDPERLDREAKALGETMRTHAEIRAALAEREGGS